MKPYRHSIPFHDKDPDEVVGYVITVEFSPFSGKPPKDFHYLGSERNAVRKGRLKINAHRVSIREAVTKQQWLDTYGYGKM